MFGKTFCIIGILLSLFISFSVLEASAQSIPADGYYYVIVIVPEFASACEPLRQLRSYDTQHQAKIVTLDEIPAAVPGKPTGQEIEAYFKNTLYPQPPNGYGTDYILLVGDTEFIPLWVKYPSGSGPADSRYTAFFDSGPQIAIGRICAHNPTEIQNYYQKIAPAGSSGTIIPNGKDKALIYFENQVFLSGEKLKDLWQPYLTIDEEDNASYLLQDILNRISIHSIQSHTGHGYGPGLRPTEVVNMYTDLKPFYFAFGCSSAAFWWEPNPPYTEHPAEYFINQSGTYSTIIGAMEDHSNTSFGPQFFKAYFVYGYERIGDMMKWAQSQPQEDSSLMTLLGDPYLKIASNQFISAPRIYVDSQKSYQRTYNLDMGSGNIDPINFSIYSFNNAQWGISNITYSDPSISSCINFSLLNGSSNQEVEVNFTNVDTILPNNYTITFEIVDVSNSNLVIKQVSLSLVITNNNILSENDFIIVGNEKRLPRGNYILQNDLTIEAGKTLVIDPGTTIKSGSYTANKIIIQSGAKIKALGTVTEPISFMPMPPDYGTGIGIEIQADAGQDYHGEFVYCLFDNPISGMNTPRLRFDNCTFSGNFFSNSLFPNPVKGEIKNSVVCRGTVSWPAKGGYLSNLKVSYSLVPRDYKGTGDGIIWDYEDFSHMQPMRPNSTSLCINGGDPNDALDSDGTRKDLGAFYFPLNSAIKVPADYPTIQQALDAAQLSETKIVMVSPGTYQENIVIPSGVRLMGASEKNRPLLQASGPNNLIQVSPFGMTYLIENFVITKQGLNKTGRALFIDNVNLFMLRNVDFADSQGNEALVYSAGNLNTLYLDKVHFINNSGNKELLHFERGNNYLLDWMRESSFENNSSNDCLLSFSVNGGFGENDLLLYKVLFANNSQTCLFANNTNLISGHGPLAYSLTVERPVFYNNNNVSIETNFLGATGIVSSTFYNNGQALPLNIAVNATSKLNITSSILWNNNIAFNKALTATLDINYTDINSTYSGSGTGNINRDPMFVSPSIEDFQLLAGSPCIDKGDPSLAVPINAGTCIDMGAFEKLQDATPPTTPEVTDEGDFTGNTNSLSARWSSNDPETGVVEYQYQIREDSPASGIVIKDWITTQVNIVMADGLILSSARSYYFCVKAKNGAGVWSEAGYSDGITVSGIVAPSNLTAATLSSSQIKLTWVDNSNNETGFKVERKTGATGNYSQITTVGANITTYTNAGLTAGTTYYYRVRAYNSIDNSYYSNEVLAVTLAAPLVAAPTNLAAEVLSSSQIKLTWLDNSNNETNFRIERRIGTSGSWISIAWLPANITTYTNAGLTAGVTYYYRVMAYNSLDNSYYSHEVPATTLATPFVAAPTNLAAEVLSSSQIKLTWVDSSNNETGFKVERKTGATGAYSQIATVGANITTYTNTSLTVGVTYYYRIRAYNSLDNSYYSNEVLAVTLAAPLVAAPTNLAAEVLSSSQIKLNWVDNSNNETNFRIERRIGATGSWSNIANAAANITTYTNTSLTAGVTYYYRIRAYNSLDNSYYSNEVLAVTLATPLVAAPTNLAAEVLSSSQIKLTWVDNSNNETNFRIERRIGTTGSWSNIANAAANITTYTNTSLTAGVTYYYRIRAYNSLDNSYYSNEVLAVTLATPLVAAPTNLAAEVLSSSQIKLTWLDNSNNETNFRIERRIGTTGSWSNIANAAANITTYTNTSLTAGVTYYYRIRAYNSLDNSYYSNEVLAVTLATPLVAAPTNLAAEVLSSSQIKLNWVDNSNNETNFRIERRIGATGSWSNIANAAANITTYTNTSLTAGVTYYYRVRAYNSLDNSYYSNEVLATTQ